ncbi:NDP-sugar epimerase, includes UDP-GlcNAc-inverting 4,6-dehydratase FlaA1 and capsular polysaccharide biosynthesis protein EpsC [Lachnospiraceae bacterium YSD2013]|nr:NDP-sugar epimerase, includes UDP-GlcNAc-inverting 4,6-dehydratase FlaA1 and capsular polysaccharide biosynthesis protein EpsC [Lachnospiraceae bacterium YSD2013]
MKNKVFSRTVYFSKDKKWIERAIALAVADAFIVAFAAVCALWMRYDFSFQTIDKNFLSNAVHMLPFDIVSTLVIFWLCKLYQSVWRYASANELIKVAIAVVLEGILQLAVFLGFGVRVPRSYYLFYVTILGIGAAGIRFSYRFLRILRSRQLSLRFGDNRKNIMIVGAGSAGNSILKEIEVSSYLTMNVCCLIDDNRGCQGKSMRGIPIVGGREAIPEAVQTYSIDEIIIAIPSAPRSEIKKIVEICKETGCTIQMVPGIYQLINGDVSISQLREVEIEDLLGREPVKINVDEIIGYIEGKTVLVTGGGGSIGSELCRQLAAHNPKRLIIVDIYENNAYDIQQELKSKFPKLDLVVLIASVRNEERIDQIFDEYRPDIVYHAAAHKHVPLMEDSPGEAIKNNVFGTYKTAKAADKYGVKKFVLVSTDKAVNPTNIMGASKRMCEMVVQMMNEQSKTDFVAVRFGNVLGSNGSVIPLFKKQIMAGGPVTVTDPNIIRYFMTIPEAVSLILQAGAYAKGGEIFVLDMGEPVKILDLAENLIKLSGFRVGEDIEIVFTGLRPGEKMYEELLMDEEGLKDTANALIHIGKPIEFNKDEFMSKLGELKEISEEHPEQVKKAVSEIVTTYKYRESVTN